MSAFIITRIQVGDYDTWRPMFDQDLPGAREKATVQRVFRKADDPNHVFIFLELLRCPTQKKLRGASSNQVCSPASPIRMDRTWSSKRHRPARSSKAPLPLCAMTSST
jgi:hypothetical protein